MVASLRTSFFDKRNSDEQLEIRDFKSIALKYLKSWFGFDVILVTIDLCFIIAEVTRDTAAGPENHYLRSLRGVRVLRFLRPSGGGGGVLGCLLRGMLFLCTCSALASLLRRLHLCRLAVFAVRAAADAPRDRRARAVAEPVVHHLTDGASADRLLLGDARAWLLLLRLRALG